MISLSLSIFIFATPLSLSIDYEKSKLLSYSDAYYKAKELKQPLIIWVDHQDEKLYHQLKTLYPKTVHTFIKNYPHPTRADLKDFKGIIISENDQHKREVKNPLIKATLFTGDACPFCVKFKPDWDKLVKTYPITFEEKEQGSPNERIPYVILDLIVEELHFPSDKIGEVKSCFQQRFQSKP